jgi:hypothetical protein
MKASSSISDKAWSQKVDNLASLYMEYSRTVCGGGYKTPEDGGKRHAEKVQEFQAELEKWKKLDLHYSLHY